MALFALSGCGGTITLESDTGASTTIDTSALPPGGCEDRVDYDDDFVFLRAVYQHDAAGHLVLYDDAFEDGTPRYHIERTYDAEGRLIGQELEAFVLAPGKRSSSWEYDADGRLIRVTTESDTDGSQELTIDYGPDGRRSHGEEHTDGVLTATADYTWTEGEPLVVEIANDSDADGAVDWTSRFTFHAGKWLVQYESLKDGVPEVTDFYTYSSDVPGRLTSRQTQWPDPSMDGYTTWDWDAAGHLVHEEYAGPSHGTYDFTYDAQDRPLVKTWKTEDLPGHDLLTLFTWTGEGLSAVERRDGTTDQLIEHWTFTRGCPADRSFGVNVAPLISWTRELPAPEYVVDIEELWGIPEVL